jgi:predicted metalloprotease with PDZ domain
MVGPRAPGSSDRSGTILNARLTDAARMIGPPLLFGVRLWASVCLALYVAFWLELGNAWLGANLQDFDGKLVVRRVAPEGPADTAGVRHGDRVTAIDGSPVHDLAEVYRALWGRGDAGITVKLTVSRQGEERQIEVKTIDRYRYLKLDTTY